MIISIAISIIFTGCGINQTTLTENIEVEIIKNKIDNCTYFCHYLEFKITNNNKVGVYFPFLFDYFDIINSQGDTITDIVRFYEDFNKNANSIKSLKGRNITEYDNLMEIYRENRKIKPIFLNDEWDDNINKQIDKEYNLLLKGLPKNTQITSNEEDIKREILTTKYAGFIHLPPNSSVILVEPINYLYYNYMVEENYMTFGHYDYKLTDTIAKQYSDFYENYENTKSSEVKIIFNYTAQSPASENDSISFPLSYFNNDLKESVKISAEFPKKIFNKYYLVENLNGKDTLIIKYND